MKKYAGAKTHEQIKAACYEAGFDIDTEKYDHGSDWVTITGTFDGHARTFIYSSFNGRFICQISEDETYSERSTDLDGTGWYDAILDFLYIPVEADSAAA